MTGTRQKHVLYAQHYNMDGARLRKLHSQPPVMVKCDDCIYSMPGECPECAGTYRTEIPTAEVMTGRRGNVSGNSRG